VVGAGRIDVAALLPLVAALRATGANVVKITPSSLFVAFDQQVQIPAEQPIGMHEDPEPDDEADEETVYHSSDG
jgi:hypothetical protein